MNHWIWWIVGAMAVVVAVVAIGSIFVLAHMPD